jgi:hypothetical protein
LYLIINFSNDNFGASCYKRPNGGVVSRHPGGPNAVAAAATTARNNSIRNSNAAADKGRVSPILLMH